MKDACIFNPRVCGALSEMSLVGVSGLQLFILAPCPHCFLKAYWLICSHTFCRSKMWCKISDSESPGVFCTINVSQHRRNQRSPPLCAHHGIQTAIFLAVLYPLLKLAEAQALPRLRYGAAPDPIED